MKTDIKTKQAPLPSQAEILHFLAKAFSLEASNQQLKDYLKHGDSNYRTKHKVISEVFVQPLNKYAGTEVTVMVKWSLAYFFDDYINNIVCKINFDSTTREQAMGIISQSYLPFISSRLIQTFEEQFKGPSIKHLFSKNESALKGVFAWIEESHPAVMANIKDDYHTDVQATSEKMAKWFSGQHIPTLTDLKGMLAFTNLSNHDRSVILCWLFIARALDWARFKNKKLGVTFYDRLYHYLNNKGQLTFADIIIPLEKYNQNFLILNQADDSFRANMPFAVMSGEIRNDYNKLVRLHEQHDKKGLLNYRLEQFKTFLYGEQPDLALKHLEFAFKQSLYRAGEFQHGLYQMALSLIKDNQPAHTRFKNQAIAFGWVEPPAEHNNESSRSGVLYDSEKAPKGKNDTKLIQLTKANDVDAVRDLLQKRKPSVDTLSAKNESVYLIAIEHAQMSKDHRLINLFLASKSTPKPKTLNTRDFGGNTPLIKAVQYGYVDIVEKLLNWRADPNLRAAETARSSLMLAVEQLLSLYKPGLLPSPIELFEKGEPRVLENLRRHLVTTGMLPPSTTLSELKEKNNEILNDPRKREIMTQVLDHLDARDNRDTSAYKQIVNLLLDAGADPNQIHEHPIPGYTPLMLAAETNDIELFTALISAGGDFRKTYKHPDRLNDIDCLEIAEYVGSDHIQNYIRSSNLGSKSKQ